MSFPPRRPLSFPSSVCHGTRSSSHWRVSLVVSSKFDSSGSICPLPLIIPAYAPPPSVIRTNVSFFVPNARDVCWVRRNAGSRFSSCQYVRTGIRNAGSNLTRPSSVPFSLPPFRSRGNDYERRPFTTIGEYVSIKAEVAFDGRNNAREGSRRELKWNVVLLWRLFACRFRGDR